MDNFWNILKLPFMTSAILFTMGGCSSIWEGYNKKALENKEYEQQVQVKEIEAPVDPAAEKKADDVKVDAAKPTKAAKVPEKVSKSKKKKVESKTPDAKTGETATTEAPQKHLPSIEDGEGFSGRRPNVDPFVAGEVIELAVRYFGAEAGRFTMTTRPMVEVNGKKSYHFSYHARSSSVFSIFYAVDDKAEAYMDYEELIPYNYSITAKESKQVRDVKNFTNHKTKKAKTWDKKIKKGATDPEIKEYEWDIVPYAQNVFTVAYYLRCFTLSVGKKLAVNVAHEGKNIIMRAEVVREEKLSTSAGKFDTFVVKPSFEIDGVFKPVGDIFLWVTNDQHKRIVRIESKIKIGTIVASVEKISP